MAKPNCLRCGSTEFEVAKLEPEKSNFSYVSIHCKACGGVHGVTDFLNIGDLLVKLTGEVRNLEGRWS